MDVVNGPDQRREAGNESSPAGAALPARAVAAVLVRPVLWPTALRMAVHLAPTGWWRRSPYLPLPDADYLRFRMVTAYGGDGSTPADEHDLVTYLRWCRNWPALVRR